MSSKEAQMSASQQQFVVSIRFKKFVLDEGARPQGNTAQRSLLAKPFAVAWSMVAHGAQAFTGATGNASFKSSSNVLQCDWKGAPAEVVLDHSVLSNSGTRVLLFRIMELEAMNIDISEGPEESAAVLQFLRSSVSGRGKGAPVLASATVDPGAFLKQPARDYCVKMESQFATVGKLYFNLVVELLEAKRFGDRAVLERRLVLRIDRVIPQRQASGPQLKQRSQSSSQVLTPEQQQQRSASSSIMSPLAPPVRAPSDVSSASNGSSLGPVSGTPLLNSSPSSLAASTATLRPGSEYTVKVRLSSGKTVYRTPLAICDTDNRIRWNYELVVPLPQDVASKSKQQPSTPTSATSPPMLDPNITTVSNSSTTSLPGASNASTSSSSGVAASHPSQPHVDKKECKLQVALLEGQQVVSAFGIDVSRLRTGRNWTEVAVPSPFSAIRYQKDGSMQTVSGSVVFEWSIRETEALKLKAESPNDAPQSPKASPRKYVSSVHRDSGETTPTLPPQVHFQQHQQQQPQQPSTNHHSKSPSAIRRKAPATDSPGKGYLIDVGPIHSSASSSASTPLDPFPPAQQQHSSTASRQQPPTRHMQSLHSFGESLCSHPASPMQPSIMPPPREVVTGAAAEGYHKSTPVALNLQQRSVLMVSTTSDETDHFVPDPHGHLATLPPTPSTAASAGPMKLHSLWEPIGTLHQGPQRSSATKRSAPSSAATVPLNRPHVPVSPTYMGLQHDNRRGDDVSPTPGLSNTQLPEMVAAQQQQQDGGGAARRLSSTASYNQLHHNATAVASQRMTTNDGELEERNAEPNLGGKPIVEHTQEVISPVDNDANLRQQVQSQNQRIIELQRQLAMLQQQQQQQSASRSTSMMSSATVGTATGSSLMTGWGSSAGGGRWRSPSSDMTTNNRSGSEGGGAGGSRRATPQRTHSLSREEVSLKMEPTNTKGAHSGRPSDGGVDSTPSRLTEGRGRSSPAPHDPRAVRASASAASITRLAPTSIATAARGRQLGR